MTQYKNKFKSRYQELAYREHFNVLASKCEKLITEIVCAREHGKCLICGGEKKTQKRYLVSSFSFLLIAYYDPLLVGMVCDECFPGYQSTISNEKYLLWLDRWLKKNNTTIDDIRKKYSSLKATSIDDLIITLKNLKIIHSGIPVIKAKCEKYDFSASIIKEAEDYSKKTGNQHRVPY